MHTFFINTSGTKFVDFSSFFDIEIETRKLIALDCPVALWDSPDRGYQACSAEIGRMIDNFQNVDNDFNIVFYVDLLEYDAYSAISDTLSDRDNKYACLLAFISIFKRSFRDTFIKRLKNEGRSPREILLIFEHNVKTDDYNALTDKLINDIRRYVAILLGLPVEGDAQPVRQYLITEDGAVDSDASADAFISKFDNFGTSFKRWILRLYKNETDSFIKALADAPHPSDAFPDQYRCFLDSVWNSRDVEDVEDGGVKISEILAAPFRTDRTASSSNRKENARRNLRLYLFLGECVQCGRLPADATKGNKDLKGLAISELSDVDWKKVEDGLEGLRMGYTKLLGEVKAGAVDFTDPELHLVPRLFSLDRSRYGLREDGGPDAVLDFEEAKEDRDSSGDEEETSDDGTISIIPKKAVMKPAERTPIIDTAHFPPFDYLGFSKTEEITKKSSCEDMLSAAKELHRHHVEYLQRLDRHITLGLSSYMGRSDENGEAVIKKRSVSIGATAADSANSSVSYSHAGEKKEEKIETVRPFSQKAYSTMLTDFLSFFASRKVGVTDITSDLEEFNHKINGISEALRKKAAVLAGTAVLLILLLVPFFVIGFDSFFESFVSNAAFWISLSVPFILLAAAFLISVIKLRAKYYDTWLEFNGRSEKALNSNAKAARDLDELLNLHIPSLKQVYEYKLDVAFYSECCRLANCKLSHHIKTLSKRIKLIRLVLEDLEYYDWEKVKKYPFSFENLELKLAFCAGENPRIYSVFDNKILGLLEKTDGGAK